MFACNGVERQGLEYTFGGDGEFCHLDGGDGFMVCT